MNHPNRNPNSRSCAPTAAQIRTARLAAEMTPGQAGALIHERASRWLRFETGEARMHAGLWELFQLKATR